MIDGINTCPASNLSTQVCASIITLIYNMDNFYDSCNTDLKTFIPKLHCTT